MKKFLEILKNCPLFSGIEEESLLRMLSCLGAKVKIYDKRDTIMAEGDAARDIGIVLSGAAQLISTDYYGNRSIIGRIGESDIFAEAFACAEIDSLPVSAEAHERAEIMFIDCSHVLHTCHNNCGFHQRLIFNLMKSLAEKTLIYHQKIDVTSKRTTREKLMSYLATQAKLSGGSSFSIPFDRQELADYLEVDRSGLSAEISKLREEGVIECRKNHFNR